MIDVDPQDRSKPVRRVLAARQWVVGRSTVSQSDVKVAVGPERDRAAIVVFKRVFGRNPDPLFTRGIGRSRIVARRLESRDNRVALVLVIGRIVNKEELVLLVLGMKSHAQQALFISSIDRIGKLEEELLDTRGSLVRKRPDRGRVLLDNEQEVRPVLRVSHGNRPIEPEVGKRDGGAQLRQAGRRSTLSRPASWPEPTAGVFCVTAAMVTAISRPRQPRVFASEILLFFRCMGIISFLQLFRLAIIPDRRDVGRALLTNTTDDNSRAGHFLG